MNLVNTPALHTNQDIIFHLSIRPSESAIVRNHFQDGKWGQEDRDGPYIRANETFEILILAEREVYKLAVNGQHVGVFRHRLPLHLVQFIHVSGDLNIDHILIEQDMQSNQPIAIGVSQSATSSAPIAMPVHLPIHTNNSIYPQPHPQGHPPPFFFSQDPPNQVRSLQ